jgi:ribonuclease HII
VCGCDEAGAGPLAGRVYAAAVILPEGLELPFLNDSKKVTPKRRDALYDQIREQAVVWAIAWAEAEEIDELDILNCRMLAMQRAIDALATSADFALIDGNRAKDFGLPVKTVVKGDSLSANIAAASVLAKVTRDDLMEAQAAEYPQYGFEIHKGYGTKAHYAALKEFGPSPIHRMTFLKKFYGQK